jgi:hypothetical protein
MKIWQSRKAHCRLEFTSQKRYSSYTWCMDVWCTDAPRHGTCRERNAPPYPDSLYATLPGCNPRPMIPRNMTPDILHASPPCEKALSPKPKVPNNAVMHSRKIPSHTAGDVSCRHLAATDPFGSSHGPLGQHFALEGWLSHLPTSSLRPPGTATQRP